MTIIKSQWVAIKKKDNMHIEGSVYCFKCKNPVANTFDLQYFKIRNKFYLTFQCRECKTYFYNKKIFRTVRNNVSS